MTKLSFTISLHSYIRTTFWTKRSLCDVKVIKRRNFAVHSPTEDCGQNQSRRKSGRTDQRFRAAEVSGHLCRWQIHQGNLRWREEASVHRRGNGRKTRFTDSGRAHFWTGQPHGQQHHQDLQETRCEGGQNDHLHHPSAQLQNVLWARSITFVGQRRVHLSGTRCWNFGIYDVSQHHSPSQVNCLRLLHVRNLRIQVKNQQQLLN